VLQDALRFLLRRIPALRHWQDRRPPERPSPAIRRNSRWAILAVTAGAAALGIWGLAVVLEPASAFGRLAVHLGAPLAALLRGALSALLEQVDVFALSAATVPASPVLAVAATGVFLVCLVALVAIGGRLYCTMVCPLGTCLGLLAQAAPFRVRADAGLCTRCGLCARRCPSSCIRVGAGGIAIDQAECVVCLDCLAACPAGGIHYGSGASAPAGLPDLPVSPPRRELLAAGSTALVMAAAVPLGAFGAAPLSRREDGGPVSPPGSGDRDHFVARCTACQLCVRLCPTHVLQPAVLEYGPAGILQPRLSFRHGFCEYDCQRCTTVCPNGALLPLALAEKQRTRLGVARLYKDLCIVYCRGEACGACMEVCPTHAVYARDDAGLLCPEMAPGACVGCGACEFACPVAPKAIEVHASAVHGRAAPPHEVPSLPAPPASASPASTADFPF
jgi:ferredoxin-type protein NapF